MISLVSFPEKQNSYTWMYKLGYTNCSLCDKKGIKFRYKNKFDVNIINVRYEERPE